MRKEIKDIYRKTRFDFSKPEKPSLPLSEWPTVWKKVFYKTYERLKKVDLPKVENLSELGKNLLSRRTTREFASSPLSYSVVSEILQLSAGISTQDSEIDFAKRTYPSAGARYPIETYIISNKIDGLDKGLYHFNVKEQNLEVLLQKNLSEDSVQILNGEIGLAPLIIILTSVIARTEVKYGANAYRFSLLEAGHIGQNISLVCENLGIGSCTIGGFDNKNISKLLDLTEEELPLYLLAAGNKK